MSCLPLAAHLSPALNDEKFGSVVMQVVSSFSVVQTGLRAQKKSHLKGGRIRFGVNPIGILACVGSVNATASAAQHSAAFMSPAAEMQLKIQ